MKDEREPQLTDQEPPSRERLPFWLRNLLANVSGSPSTFWTRFLGGIVATAIIALLSLHPILTRTLRMYTKTHPLVPFQIATGSVAVLFGLIVLSAAAFLHFHFAWPRRSYVVSGFGKIVSFLVGTVLAIVFIWKLFAR